MSGERGHRVDVADGDHVGARPAHGQQPVAVVDPQQLRAVVPTPERVQVGRREDRGDGVPLKEFQHLGAIGFRERADPRGGSGPEAAHSAHGCLLYTSDAADE